MKTFLIFSILLQSLAIRVASQDLRLQKTSFGSGEIHRILNTRSLKVCAIIGQSSPVAHLQNNGLHLLQGFMTPYTSTSKTMESEHISIYPNPSFGKISIEWKNDFSEGSLKIQLVEMSGKLIDERSVKKSSNKVTVDFSEAACGIYILRIKDQKSETTNTKLFIQ